jgi:DNA-binding CsgD family transcriptional regulator/PAS domain-containing protein
MPSLDRMSELIGDLYDCVTHPDRWESILDSIRTELNFANAVLAANALPSGITSIAVSVGITPEWLVRMQSYGSDIIQAWGGVGRVNAFPLDEPILQTQATPAAQLRKNRFIAEWGEPQGLIDAVTIPFARDPTMVGSLTCGRHHSAGEVRASEMTTLRLTAPHIRRAVLISNLLEQKTVAAATFASVLETISAGVLIVDENLAIVHANAAGSIMLCAGDPVRTHQGMLVLGSTMTTDALRTAVKVAGESELRLGRQGIGIPLRYRDGAPAILHVLPLRRRQVRQGFVQQAAAALFVAPAASPPRLLADAIALLYDLTPAEVRIFELIVEGQTQREIADRLSIAASTVKTHLLRIFEKTGCNRQASLVKLACSLSAPV